MENKNNHHFPGFVTVFHERRLPVAAIPAGYAALIGAYSLAVPLPRILSATGKRHTLISEDSWRILTPRHAPDSTLESHLTFALKHEGIDLLVLKKLFEATGAKAVEVVWPFSSMAADLMKNPTSDAKPSFSVVAISNPACASATLRLPVMPCATN